MLVLVLVLWLVVVVVLVLVLWFWCWCKVGTQGFGTEKRKEMGIEYEVIMGQEYHECCQDSG